MKKSLIFFIMIIFLLGLFLSTVIIDEAIVFEDENFELAVRGMLNHSGKPIYKSQVLSIVEMNLAGREISNLAGIESFRNLEILNLSQNEIENVNQLKNLNKLKKLDLSNNKIVDLEDAEFDEITHLGLISLNLDHNLGLHENGDEVRLSNIDLLAKFRSLETLSLRDNHIADFSPLFSLIHLRELNLSENNIEDLSFLENLLQLNYLNLRGNKIEDLSMLSNLDNLTYLNLHSNEKIKSIKPLESLKNLEELILRNVPIRDDVYVLQNFPQLIYLNVRNCGISDFGPIAKLMANGALQNDLEKGVLAAINIRDNFISDDDPDPLHVLRRYWNNIETRDPYSLPPLTSAIDEPKFSHSSGYYSEAFDLSISTNNPNLEIYFTLDGSDPNIDDLRSSNSAYEKSFKYDGPLEVKSRIGEKNVFSNIQTAYRGRPWLPEWSPPNGEVFKATVVRAITYDPESDIKSNIITQTFFVDRDINGRYSTLPVISLVGDYEVLFDEDEGIYITDFYGFPFRYNESKVPANIEFFEPGGELGFEGRYEIALQGATSPASPQKGLHVFAGMWSSGEEYIEYPLFKNSASRANKLEKFERFMIRAWGSARNWPIFFADAYHQMLMASSDQDIQAYQPVIVFINGEYWGLHEMREANKNSWYYEAHYYDGKDMAFDLLDWGGTIVDEGDSKHWDSLLDYLDQHDVRSKETYEYIKTQIDIDNFIVYMIHCIYTGKMDWPNQNEYLWRPKTKDGKWRWTQFDMDQGISGWAGPEHDMIATIMQDGERPHHLFNLLIRNDEFKNLFINYFADLMNTYFLTEKEIELFNEMFYQLDPYMEEYQDRWQLNYDWEENRQFALNLLSRRWDVRKKQVIENFGLNGSSQLNIQTDISMGNVAINSIVINEDTIGVVDPADWTGMYFNDIPIQISAVPLPGFRFVQWESTVDVDHYSQNLVLNIEKDTSLTAIFAPVK